MITRKRSALLIMCVLGVSLAVLPLGACRQRSEEFSFEEVIAKVHTASNLTSSHHYIETSRIFTKVRESSPEEVREFNTEYKYVAPDCKWYRMESRFFWVGEPVEVGGHDMGVYRG